jgi:DNA-binding CsgD family transcriptional regulator
MAATARWMLAVLENSLGNYEASLTAAQAASEHPWVGIWALPEVIESAARVGQNDTAAAAVTQLAGIVGPADTSWGLGLLTRSQALVTTGPDADELYEASIGHLERSTIVPELARTRLLYGEWLHRHRRRRDARTQLSMAHQTFDAIGAEAFARRAGAALRTAGGKPTTTGMTDPTYLTPQEARIAQLVRDGLSNQDIGAHLFVSPRTVEYHLHKVYQKLNLTSRTQLASAMSPHRDEQTSPHGSREP